MKKLLAILLAVTMLLSMAACGGETPNTGKTDPISSNTQPDAPESGETTEPEKTDPAVSEEWGKRDRHAWSTDAGLTGAYINFPYYVGIPEATGLVAVQGDGTYIIWDGYVEGASPDVSSVEEVFPAYFKQVHRVFEVNYGSRYGGGEFAVDSKEMLEINDYEMCKVTGTHTFTYKREEMSRQFVAYATQLKDNGAYIYWLVQDETDDQSMFETLEDHAYNMALTLEEIKD